MSLESIIPADVLQLQQSAACLALITLLALSVCSVLITAIFGKREPSSAYTGQGHDPELLAVIAAAATVALGRPHRVVSIQPVSSSSWTQEGRARHHASHKIR